MNTPRFIGVLGSAIFASTLCAQPITDDFDLYPVGEFPASAWGDIGDRSDTSTSEIPTMRIIETTDPAGQPTRALQTLREPGTNGIFSDIEPADIHRLSMDVRIDGFPFPNSGWPAGLGFVQYSGKGDVNNNPQAILYSWTDGYWRLFVAPGGGRPAIDQLLFGPRFTLNKWYTISLEADTQSGRFEARVSDAQTGELINALIHNYDHDNDWDPVGDQYNSIVFFDGDTEESSPFGQATIDRLEYTPIFTEGFEDDFESYAVGPVPVGQWNDVFDRVGDPTVPAPTANLIETIGPDGEPTQAIQTVAALRSASGIYREVSPADFQSVSVDVRIDQFAGPGQGWPIGVGFSGAGENPDINGNPQALIYAWTTRVWNLFITRGAGGLVADTTIVMPPVEVDKWYTLTLEMYTDRGMFSATVADAATGVVLGEASHQVTNMDASLRMLDAIAFFDGEVPGATTFGQATLDSVVYRATRPPECRVDYTGDGLLDFFDVSAFLDAFAADDASADLTNDGLFNFFDVSAFLAAFVKGCP